MLAEISRLTHKLIAKAGYRLSTRRLGERKLALWKRVYRKRKNPRRLVVIPGMGDSPLSWAFCLAPIGWVLRLRFDEVVLFDFPGFLGLLSNEKSISSMDHLIEAVDDALDSLRPDTILGHSLGGWLTGDYLVRCAKGERPLHLQRRYTGPRQAIVICPSGVLVRRSEASAWRARFVDSGKGDFEYSRGLTFAGSRWLKLFSGQMDRFLKAPETLAFIDSIEDRHFIHSDLGKVKCPVWVIWGERDQINDTHWVKDWMNALPPGQGRAVTIRRAGHLPQFERPLVTATILGQILSGKTGKLESTALGWQLERN